MKTRCAIWLCPTSHRTFSEANDHKVLANSFRCLGGIELLVGCALMFSLFLQLSLRKKGPSWWVSRNCDQIWKSDMSRVWVQKRESRGLKKPANVWVESWTFGPKSQLSSGFIPHFSSPTTPFCSNKFIFDASVTFNHQPILFSKRVILYCYPVIGAWKLEKMWPTSRPERRMIPALYWEPRRCRASNQKSRSCNLIIPSRSLTY